MPLHETPQDASSDDAATGPEPGERQPKRITQRGLWFEEFEVGATYKHWPGKTVTEYDDHLFCLITMNHHPLHINDVHANASQQGRNVVVVEDTSTTGGSALTAVEALQKAGANVVAVAVIVDRRTGAKERIEETAGVPCLYAYSKSELGLDD